MTKPLTSSDCDLRDFQYMPLDVVRLRDSELATTATGEEAFAAVLLWCASWHQVPAASLPNDDRMLSNYAGYGRGIKEFLKIKAGAMRGWILCDDGRFYHPVVAEKARESWLAKLKQRYNTECARIKKQAQRTDTTAVYPTYEEWVMSRGTAYECPDGHDRNVPEDIPPMSRQCPPENTIQGKGREVKGSKEEDQERSLRSLRADETAESWKSETSEAWKAFEAHHQQTRKWSAARRMLALGQLAAIEAEGGNPETVITWALSRGLADLADCARRMAADAAKEKNHEPANQSGQSLADQGYERLKLIPGFAATG